MREPPRAPDPAGATLSAVADRARHRHDGGAPDPALVEEVVRAVIDTVSGRLSATEAKLMDEIAGLGRIIEETKDDIAEVSRDAIRGSHIPSATGELDAILEHTAIATNRILEACETLDEVAAKLDAAQADVLRGVTTEIYEACSFQDITGQRITKVVKALKAIEERVAAMSEGRPAPRPEAIPARVASVSDPESLLNGPGLAHEAMGQDAIDKLLADFD